MPMLAEEHADSIQVAKPEYISVVDLSPLRVGLGVVLPMVAYDFMYFRQDMSVVRMRDHYAPNHCAGWDDVTQFMPLAATWTMQLVGVQSRSENKWEALTAHAASYAIGLGTMYAGKYIVKRTRPDGGDQLSFPSGHTTSAFIAATILDAEYGSKYPWLSGIGYGIATLTGVGRVLNNRHWATDVVTGAGVGIAGTYLGYLVSDLIWGRGLKRFELEEEREGYESYGYMVLRKGRTDLLSKLLGYKGTLGSDITLMARCPVYRQIGVRLQGGLWENYNPDNQEGINSYMAMLGADFMQGFWDGRLWVDGAVAAGYHAPFKKSVGYGDGARGEAETIMGGGFAAQASVGLSYLLTNSLALNVSADYTILPKNKIQGFGGGVGLAYVFSK